MSTTKRMTLTRVGPATGGPVISSGQQDQANGSAATAAAAQLPGQKKADQSDLPKRTIRFNLQLGESNTKTFPEFFFSDLLDNVQTEAKKDINPDEPLDESAVDKNVQDIVKRLETKYGGGTTAAKSRRKRAWEDFVDKGQGYDETDPFIDNEEAYDELLPSTMTTKLGGFYINSGALEFTNISSGDENERRERKKKKAEKRKLSAQTDSDSTKAKKRTVAQLIAARRSKNFKEESSSEDSSDDDEDEDSSGDDDNPADPTEEPKKPDSKTVTDVIDLVARGKKKTNGQRAPSSRPASPSNIVIPTKYSAASAVKMVKDLNSSRESVVQRTEKPPSTLNPNANLPPPQLTVGVKSSKDMNSSKVSLLHRPMSPPALTSKQLPPHMSSGMKRPKDVIISKKRLAMMKQHEAFREAGVPSVGLNHNQKPQLSHQQHLGSMTSSKDMSSTKEGLMHRSSPSLMNHHKQQALQPSTSSKSSRDLNSSKESLLNRSSPSLLNHKKLQQPQQQQQHQQQQQQQQPQTSHHHPYSVSALVGRSNSPSQAHQPQNPQNLSKSGSSVIKSAPPPTLGLSLGAGEGFHERILDRIITQTLNKDAFPSASVTIKQEKHSPNNGHSSMKHSSPPLNVKPSDLSTKPSSTLGASSTTDYSRAIEQTIFNTLSECMTMPKEKEKRSPSSGHASGSSPSSRTANPPMTQSKAGHHSRIVQNHAQGQHKVIGLPPPAHGASRPSSSSKLSSSSKRQSHSNSDRAAISPSLPPPQPPARSSSKEATVTSNAQAVYDMMMSDMLYRHTAASIASNHHRMSGVFSTMANMTTPSLTATVQPSQRPIVTTSTNSSASPLDFLASVAQAQNSPYHNFHTYAAAPPPGRPS